jgi:hypothetical protein
MCGGDAARPEHILIAEPGAQRFAVNYGTSAVPCDDGAKLLAASINEDAGFPHAPGGEALDRAMRLGCLGKPREHLRNRLPKFLRVIFGKAGLRDMRRRRFGGFGQNAPFEIYGDRPDPARAEIEAREQRCAAQSLAPYGAKGQAADNVALGDERDDDRRDDRGHGSDPHEPELHTARIDSARNVNRHGNRLAAAD